MFQLLDINLYENLIVPMAFMNTRIRMAYYPEGKILIEEFGE
jgi:hypothetical protein